MKSGDRSISRVRGARLGAALALCASLVVGPAPAVRGDSIGRARFEGGEVALRPRAVPGALVDYGEGVRLGADFRGPSSVVRAMGSSRARALSLAAADFDADGIDDLACGYRIGESGGAVAVWRGAPRAAGSLDEVGEAPYRRDVSVFAIPGAADFLAAGDLDGDGRADLVAGTKNAVSLAILRGDGRGGFARGSEPLPAPLVAVAAGDVGRPDAIADVAALVADEGATRVLVLARVGEASAETRFDAETPFPCDAVAVGADGGAFVSNANRALRAAGSLDDRLDEDGKDDSSASRGFADAALDVVRRRGAANVSISTETGEAPSPRMRVVDAFGRVAGELEGSGATRAALAVRLGADAWPDVVAVDDLSPLPAVAESKARATITVTTAADDGPGSLRQAIFSAGATPETDTIAFAIPGAGVHTIRLATPLPAILDPMTIDATTQPGYAGTPLVEIDASAAGEGAGFEVSSTNVAIRGFAIGGASGPGISLFEGGGAVIAGNFIGTNAAGTAARPNAGDGVSITASANNTVGGTVAGARNVISGNGSSGVALGDGASGNAIVGNYVGTSASGATALANGASGVLVDAAPNTSVGGTAAHAGNVVSGNTELGVGIFGASPNATVRGNLIGTDASGEAAIGNGGDGVLVQGAAGATIGGASPAARNVLSGNGQNGVALVTATTTGAVVAGNYAGTDASGGDAIPNVGNGVYLEGAVGARVGGSAPGEGNLISGNASLGVGLFAGATGARIVGNTIGQTALGGVLGNFADGVYEEASSGNVVGGREPGEANRIAYNGASGVRVYSGERDTVSRNSFVGNGWLAIDLGEGGAEAPDAGDADGGANGLLNAPALTSVESGSGGTFVRGTYRGAAGATFRVELFASAECDPFGNGEAETYLGDTMVTTDASGVATFEVSLDAQVPAGSVATATATDASGSTSELSECVVVELHWQPPTAAGGPPINLTVTTGGTTAPKSGDETGGALGAREAAPGAFGDASSAPGDAPAAAPTPRELVGYRVYQSAQSPVAIVPGNVAGETPASKTSMGLPARKPGFAVVTALYGDGSESGPSNEVATPGAPVVASIAAKGNGASLTITGSNFSRQAEVIVDGMGFSQPARVKRNGSRVVQKGRLENGQTFGAYLASRPVRPDGSREVLVGVRNDSGATTSLVYER